MEKDEILQISIDENEKLCISPMTKTFPYIYREAMEVHWNNEGKYLYSPKPREWSFLDWYLQIIKAAKKQSCQLIITEKTKWINVPEKLKENILKQQ